MKIPFFISRLFGNDGKPTTDQIKDKLPFVKLFGYEKSYGAPQPNDFNEFVKNYKSWPYACANKNAYSVAKCKLRLYKQTTDEDGDEQLNEIKKHPLLDTLQSVNPYSNRFELLSITQIFLELTGNAYWWMPRNNVRIPAMIWHIPANWMKVVPSKEEFVSGYVMRAPNTGVDVPFPADEIVHFKFPSPFNLFYGTGPLYAAAYGIDLNKEIKTWGINYFINNAQPSGVLYSDSSLGEGQYQRLRDSWNKKYKGSENAGKIAILESGLKYQQTGSSLKDAKFEDVSKEIRDEILAIFGVPASKLGLVEDVNRANADANDYTYQKETILPRLILMEEKMNEKIVPLYDQDLILKFDSPVPDDRDFRLREREANIRSGYSSIDEEREEDGLEPYELPETSVPLIPFALTPAGQPKPEPITPYTPGEPAEGKSFIKSKRDDKWAIFATTTAPQEKTMNESMARFFENQHGEVMRNLNKYREASAGIVKKDVSAYILFNMKEANEKLKSYAKTSIRNAYVSGLMLGMRDTNSAIDFNLFEPNIYRAVESRLNFFAEKVNDNTFNLISDTINEGLGKGESISDISKRIDNIYEYSRLHRSRVTAQTEVIGATNDGQLRAYHEAGMEAKEWLSARDEKVRDSHQAAEGQIVGITEDFTTGDGNKLQYPGDRNSGADAGDIINCRCTVLPVLKKP